MCPRTVSVPGFSSVHARVCGAHIFDVRETDDVAPLASAIESWLGIVERTPGWMSRAMDWPKAVVSRLGLKDLGCLQPMRPADSADTVGDGVGTFSLQHLSQDEVVTPDADRHLDVWRTLLKLRAQREIVVSTVVRMHTWGRLYMLPVAPAHRLIVPAMLATTSTGQNPT